MGDTNDRLRMQDAGEERMQVAGVDVVVTGPHNPEPIIGKPMGTKCMARDRQRVDRESDRTAVGEISYEATIGPLWCMNGQPWETVVSGQG